MEKKKLVIGVTDCSKFSSYSQWIEQGNEDIEIVKLGYRENNFDEIKKCNGIVLTGGEDVHPRLYHQPEYYALCFEDDVNENRDLFEWKIMEFTEQNSIPVLGICRGLQLVNVFFGGTLIPDIPTWGKFDHSKIKNGDRYHKVQVDTTSWLYNTVAIDEGMVNSNHHQSADKIGKGLVVSALSPDGVVEALERKETGAHSFLCLVQWHPERMNDQDSPLVRNIKHAFIEAVKKKSR